MSIGVSSHAMTDSVHASLMPFSTDRCCHAPGSLLDVDAVMVDVTVFLSRSSTQTIQLIERSETQLNAMGL